VPKERVVDGGERFEIEILDERHNAKIQAGPRVDPDGARVRG